MSRPRNPSGTRRPRTYVRNGKTVHDRGARIKRRQAPKRRLNATAKRRAQRKPLLAGAAGLLGLGALDAILMGRWGGFLVLGSLAVGLGITHFAWQWHKNRQARKPRVSAAEQRRQAREQRKAASTHKEPSEGPPELLSAGAPGTKKAAAPKQQQAPAGGPRQGTPAARGAHLLSAEEAHAYTAPTEPSSPPERKSYDTPQKDVGTFKLSAAQAEALGGGWKAGDRQCKAHGSGRSAGCPSCRSIGALR